MKNVQQLSAPSRRMRQVAAWFDLPLDPPVSPRIDVPALPQAGQILLLTGGSGSGKSVLLRAIAAAERAAGQRVVLDLRGVRCAASLAAVDQFPGESAEQAVARLCQAGLGEAQTYLRRPHELSEGQRFRLRLAIAAYRAVGPTLLICDEFTAELDRVTAAVVSRGVRRLLKRTPSLAAVLATGHDDLELALMPDAIVRCDTYAP